MRRARTAAALLLVAALAGCAQNGGGAVPDPGTQVTGPGEPAVPTKAVPDGLATVSPAPEKPGSQTTDEQRRRAERAGKVAAQKLEAAAKRLGQTISDPSRSFVMPRLTGRNLQASQDRLQASDSYLLDERDATDQGRLQLSDRDWRVCRQDPAPGVRVPITHLVTLWSVRLDERCP